LKVALNTISQTNPPFNVVVYIVYLAVVAGN
jgi:hypothetical protein